MLSSHISGSGKNITSLVFGGLTKLSLAFSCTFILTFIVAHLFPPFMYVKCCHIGSKHFSTSFFCYSVDPFGINIKCFKIIVLFSAFSVIHLGVGGL